MKSLDWLTAHDLSLTFANGRLWKFRPTAGRHGAQPVDATIAGGAIELTVAIPGLRSGDVDLRTQGDVLQIRGKADSTMHLACDVGMPAPVDLAAVETTYRGAELAIRVPLKQPAAEEITLESIAVAV